MIGFKKTPIRLVLITFLICVVSIILIYVDSLNNEPLAIEEITISRDLSESLTPIKSKQIHTVRKGDSLSVIFEDKQVPLNTAYKIFDFDKNNLLSSIIPGDIMEFNYMGNDLLSIEIIKDDVNSILIKTEDEISIVNIKKEAQTITSFGFGEIRDSFYKSAKDVGIPDSIIMDFAYIFGWDIDFIFDVRKGDKFSVIYETEFSEGEKISSGDIVFAEFTNREKKYIAQRFFDDVQGKQYFNENGENVKKAFLRAPLDFAYISSHFNPNRMHPILHKIKAHNGVDYAAKRNTPVKASGDGVISFIGRQSGYGRTVEIKHGGNIKTLYAHLERFNTKLKVGSKVKQGEIIAFVGDSGQATGPHLHFEFWQGEIRSDPVKVKLPSAKPINNAQRNEFEDLLALNLNKLNEYNPPKYE
ncbi:peptidoglycan DD-metalloendopeptidase family protein [Gammaproteobacteria bacterium]|nr:peptidoglycan DD-metalloendopeptidase family protein [Gammaproteobacteria bacterium]